MASSLLPSLPSSPPSSSPDVLKELIEDIQNGNIQGVRDTLVLHPTAVHCTYNKPKKTTPLITAIKKANLQIIKLLLEKGANVEQCGGGKYSESPLFHAIRTNDNAVIDLMVQVCDVNKKMGERCFSPLHEAVDLNNEAIVAMLVTYPGTDLNTQDKNLNTPLHIAVEKDLVNIVKILIEVPSRIDFNLKNRNGLTASMVNTAGSSQACKLVKALTKTLSHRRRCGRDKIDFAPKVPCENIAQEYSPGVYHQEVSRSPATSLQYSTSDSPPVSTNDVPSPMPVEDPSRSRSTSSGSDGFNEMHKPCGGYALRERPMGSIPAESTTSDTRKLVLPKDEQGEITSAVAELSIEEVFEEHPSPARLLHTENPRNAASSTTDKQTDVARDPTINDLNYDHLKKLSYFLDPHSVVGNYRDLGLCMFIGKKELLEDVNRLHLAYLGGGSPGTAVLDYLQVKGCSVRDFVAVAKQLRRNDVAAIFEDFNDEQLDENMDSLDQPIKHRISNLLELNVCGIPDWRDFAYKGGCSEEKVKEFATAVTDKLVYSPTEALVSLAKVNLPMYKLTELRSCLSTLGRNDVVSYLDSVILNLVS